MRKLKLNELNRLSLEAYQAVPKHPVVVVLDNLRSMVNVGAVFRTADAFRVAKIWLAGITPHPPHREIHKTALGAEESVAWEAHPDAGILAQQLREEGYLLVCVEQTEDSVLLTDYQPVPGQKIALFMGNEVEGVSESALARCDLALEIPQHGTKHSLNVSVAAGIVLYALLAGQSPG